MNDLDFVQLLNAHMSHDFAGAAGSLGNGVEFYKSAPDAETKEAAAELVESSSNHIISILKAYRYAYGTAKTFGEADLHEVVELMQGLLVDDEVAINFEEQYMHVADVFICSNTSKLILSTMMLAQQVMIYGGEIQVKITKEITGHKIVISAIAKEHNVRNHVHDILKGKLDKAEVTTKNVHVYYMWRLIENLRLVFDIEETDGRIDYIIEQ